ncbi:MAG: hypoxanthine phosphoribosyltransferase [Deltaproteobacteria bacterium]|nr:hypoxanthine phosphoribosyltransferase [Candidatus Deferrimicrobiaceae bacterium]
MTADEPAVLVTEEAIRRRVAEMARRISSDYAGVEELLLVGILRGCFIFLADLSRLLTVPRSVDFIAVSSYGKSATSTGAVRLIMDLRTEIAGKHVLIVDDIVDTGYTLQYLFNALKPRMPASLKTCVLLRKPDLFKMDWKIDYLGFDIPDVWVVGYGLDYADRYRTLPYIGTVKT